MRKKLKLKNQLKNVDDSDSIVLTLSHNDKPLNWVRVNSKFLKNKRFRNVTLAYAATHLFGIDFRE